MDGPDENAFRRRMRKVAQNAEDVHAHGDFSPICGSSFIESI